MYSGCFGEQVIYFYSTELEAQKIQRIWGAAQQGLKVPSYLEAKGWELASNQMPNLFNKIVQSSVTMRTMHTRAFPCKSAKSLSKEK